MHHRIGSMLLQRCGDLGAIGQITLDEHGVRMNRGTMPLIEIIEHDHLVPAANQLLDGNAPDVTGSARDEKFHAFHSR